MRSIGFLLLTAISVAPLLPIGLAQTLTTTATSAQFTLPTEADVGLPVIPNVLDPEAVDAQSICPGYQASNVRGSANGFTADLKLAGAACNVYGNDVPALELLVEYQDDTRLAINIKPAYLVSGLEISCAV